MGGSWQDPELHRRQARDDGAPTQEQILHAAFHEDISPLDPLGPGRSRRQFRSVFYAFALLLLGLAAGLLPSAGPRRSPHRGFGGSHPGDHLCASGWGPELEAPTRLLPYPNPFERNRSMRDFVAYSVSTATSSTRSKAGAVRPGVPTLRHRRCSPRAERGDAQESEPVLKLSTSTFHRRLAADSAAPQTYSSRLG